MTSYKHVFFEPWIGAEYGRDGLWGRKVLVVGESHYEQFHSDKEAEKNGTPKPKQALDRDWTQECAQDVVNEPPKLTAFWTSVRNRIGEDEYESARPMMFWQRVAYYNFVQTPVGGASCVAPTRKQFEESVDAFLEVISLIASERIVIMGERTNPHAPPTRR